MNRDIEQSIERTKRGFEESFETSAFYHRQTKDETHLRMILDSLTIQSGMKILDLGTGTGYLAFPLAKTCPGAQVTGLDIVEKALIENRRNAKRQELENLTFISYDGLCLPFKDSSFDLVVSRYALHHFPKITDAFREIGRVLKPSGKFFLADPAPNAEDTGRFVDAYMQMKDDGHVKFYTKREWVELGKAAGLTLVQEFETKIRFPRKRAAAPEFEKILGRFESATVKGYDLKVTAEEIYITENVNNLLFEKSDQRGGVL